VAREIQVRSRRIYEGRVVNLRVDAVRLPDGREVEREVVEHPGAAAVVPLTERDEVLMVRQYRYAVGQILLELPAGTLEPGEDPLATLFYSPGFLTEVMHLFLASDLVEGEPRPGPDERLTVERIPLPEAVELVRRGEVRDAKSVAGLLLVARMKGI
jgi:ADP-ribose pyrophosphatase